MTGLQDQEIVQSGFMGLPITTFCFLAMAFIGYAVKQGIILGSEVQEAAIEAQHIQYYPEDLTRNFFFVPDFTMTRTRTYLNLVEKAIDFWSNPQNLYQLTGNELKLFWVSLDTLKAPIDHLGSHCEMITDLNDSYINGNLEHVTEFVHQFAILAAKLENLDSMLQIVTAFVQ